LNDTPLFVLEVGILKIGVVGATGEVGVTMVALIGKYSLNPEELRLFASERSAGKQVEFNGRGLRVEKLDEQVMKEKYDYLLFSAGAEVSKRYAPIAAKAGNTIIDNSSAFRAYAEIPLCVPEINGDLLEGYSGIISNPNCSTIQMVLALEGVRKYGIEEIVVSTYQSVSGAGHSALEEYRAQVKGSEAHAVFPKRIFGNVIPLIGAMDAETGFTSEDLKMLDETRKIFDDTSIEVYPTAVRVPVEYCHCESVCVKLRSDINAEKFKESVNTTPNVTYTENIITPEEVAGSDDTYVCRYRKRNDRHLIWIVADNIHVGAATNALRILMKHQKLNG
jgi:aspartate-semialdehyde dehydrogenase